MKRLVPFLADPRGATGIEYAMIAALVGVAIIAGAGLLGTTLNAKFQGVGDKVAAVAP